MDMNKDVDPQETQEWLDAIDGVLEHEGPDRAHFLIEQVIDKSRRSGAYMPFSANTAYINTIPVDKQPKMPGDQTIEEKIRNYARWNAMAMVLRANKDTNVGGHIASYASAATLYDVGFNHFWHAPSKDHGGDLIFVQGHSAPGVYARAYMLGRLTDEQMDNFRQEVDGKGISSYPHPWLMPEFWQFPTVSMGLGPMMAIYQARFIRYLENRGMVTPSEKKTSPSPRTCQRVSSPRPVSRAVPSSFAGTPRARSSSVNRIAKSWPTTSLSPRRKIRSAPAFQVSIFPSFSIRKIAYSFASSTMRRKTLSAEPSRLVIRSTFVMRKPCHSGNGSRAALVRSESLPCWGVAKW